MIPFIIYLRRSLSFLTGVIGFTGVILLIMNLDWGLIFIGTVAGFIAPFLLGFALMPSALFMLPMPYLIENKKDFLFDVLSFLTTLYIGLVFGLWSISVLVLFLDLTDSFWGGLFFAYVVAMGPIIWLNEYGRNPNDYLSNMNTEMNSINVELSFAVAMIRGALNESQVIDYILYYAASFVFLGSLSTLINRHFRNLEKSL